MNEDTKIYIIECEEKNPRTGIKQIIVSHGVGNNTLRSYPLCQCNIADYGKDLKHDEAGVYLEI